MANPRQLMKNQNYYFLCLTCIFVLGLISSCTISMVTPMPNPTATQKSIPTLISTATPALVTCTQTRGKFEFHEIQTQNMTHPLLFRVYLPACYGMEKDMHYPVLYLLHGQSFNDDQWDRLGADEALDSLITEGEAPPFIIVMPKESNYMINQWESKYGLALAEELVPWVDAHYQTCSDRACRAIGGLSRGAGWAMRIGLIYWQTFGAIGAHSLAPFRGDFNAAPLWIKAIPPDELPRIWIDVGNRDFMADPARVWKDRLDDYKVPNEWVVLPGSHNEKYWSENVSVYLHWYAKSWIK
jgi:enterochelin esterase-like enzyme